MNQPAAFGRNQDWGKTGTLPSCGISLPFCFGIHIHTYTQTHTQTWLMILSSLPFQFPAIPASCFCDTGCLVPSCFLQIEWPSSGLVRSAVEGSSYKDELGSWAKLRSPGLLEEPFAGTWAHQKAYHCYCHHHHGRCSSWIAPPVLQGALGLACFQLSLIV